jgi:hypothetical protein
MTNPTAQDIEQAINEITGAPTVGPIADITPALAKGLHQWLNKGDGKEARIVKAPETRTTPKP